MVRAISAGASNGSNWISSGSGSRRCRRQSRVSSQRSTERTTANITTAPSTVTTIDTIVSKRSCSPLPADPLLLVGSTGSAVSEVGKVS